MSKDIYYPYNELDRIRRTLEGARARIKSEFVFKNPPQEVTLQLLHDMELTLREAVADLEHLKPELWPNQGLDSIS